MNKVEISDIKNYIQNYFSEIFSESVTIEIKGNSYVLNNSLSFDIYDFWNKKDEELFDDFNDFSFNNDYIGTIFFFLSGYWEYNHYDIKDLKNRFPAEESFPFKKDVLEEPVVDILSEKIKNKLNLTYKDQTSKIFITHDIDLLGFAKGKKFIRNILGDTMYDLYKHMEETFNEDNIKKYGLKKENYILATIHRDFNTDKKEKLEEIIEQLNKINNEMQVVIPLHPRTKNKLQEFQLKPEFKIIEPLGYIEIQSLAKYSKFVVTDSSGLQKEAYYGGKRSIVVMPDTGWRELVENKWNKLSESDEIYEKYNQMKYENVDYPDNVYGDGDCSSKIVDIISKFEGGFYEI